MSNQMRNQEKYQKTFSVLHASDGLVWEVEKRILQKKKHRKNIAVAAALTAIVFVGTAGTAFAAIPQLREAVISFFSEGTIEKIPVSEPGVGKAGENSAVRPEAGNAVKASSVNSGAGKTEGQSAGVSVGDITLIGEKKLDSHFTAAYFTSAGFMDTIKTPSGRLLFYSVLSPGSDRTYYQYENGELTMPQAQNGETESRVSLGRLPGVMSYEMDAGYRDVVLPEMSFHIKWQQLGEDIVVLNEDARRFDIGSTFGGTLHGQSIEGEYDGCFYARGIAGNSDWVQVFFEFDSQRTAYSYPFLCNIRNGKVDNPLAGVDLSAYPCITDLCISDDMKTASAMAGDDHNLQHEIIIDLETGEITDDWNMADMTNTTAMTNTADTTNIADIANAMNNVNTTNAACPMENAYMSAATSSYTIFYAQGTEENMNGYIYDTKTCETIPVFENCAWGYGWEEGFADTYVNLIGAGYAVYYKEPENEVYLLSLTDGSKKLLEGVPASHDISFFWNGEKTLLSISFEGEHGAKRLAFYHPGTDTAHYFDRDIPDSVEENAAWWYNENGYIIQGTSVDGEQNYLYVYFYK